MLREGSPSCDCPCCSANKEILDLDSRLLATDQLMKLAVASKRYESAKTVLAECALDLLALHKDREHGKWLVWCWQSILRGVYLENREGDWASRVAGKVHQLYKEHRKEPQMFKLGTPPCSNANFLSFFTLPNSSLQMSSFWSSNCSTTCPTIGLPVKNPQRGSTGGSLIHWTTQKCLKGTRCELTTLLEKEIG